VDIVDGIIKMKIQNNADQNPANPNFFLSSLCHFLKFCYSLKKDGNSIRLSYPNRPYSVICAYSEKRAKKDKRESDKQHVRAPELRGLENNSHYKAI
jgi:hypothetical protein